MYPLILFSTNADCIGEPGYINLENENILYHIFEKHSFKINKATVCDHMPPKMLKMCSNELSVTLMELLNYAFKHKRFPDEI